MISMKQKTCKWILIFLCITLVISCVSFAGCMSEHAVKGSDTKAATTVDEKKSSDSGDTTVTVSSDEKGTSSVAEGITTTGNTAPVSRGDSKSGTTFEINNYNDLQLFAVMVNGGEFNGTTYISDPTLNAVLTKSFECYDNRDWTPIGDNEDHAYKGTFSGKDGNVYTIKGLSNNGVDFKPECAGLFGWIDTDGTVENICIEDADITCQSSSTGRVYAGALVGYNEGNLTGIQIKSNVNVEVKSGSSNSNIQEDYAGGIAGYNKGTITVSYSSGENTISSISNNSNVNNTSYVGGLVGYNEGIVEKCYSDGSGEIKAVARSDAYVGALVGYNETGATITVCENRGSANIIANLSVAEKKAAAGGIVGYNNGNIEKTFCSGSGDIQAKYSLIKKDSNYYAGALVGWNGPDAIITYCYNCGNATVSATGANQPTCAGGMIGYNQGTIEKSYRSGSGDISAKGSGSSYAGALAGYNDGSSAKILNCYNCGNGVIKAATAAGGLAGYNSGTVQYAYHCGRDDISAATIGGVIGKNEGTVTNCYYDRNVYAINGATKENNWKAIGDGEGSGTSVTGLTTDSMTGENAIDPGNMNFEAGEESPWYPGLEYESGGLSCDCYPHLHGFVYDTTKDIADWPPRGVYKIDSYEKLKQFAKIVNAGNANVNAILTADITCNDDKWIPIGDGSGSGNAQIKYIGTFDGCGHTITGLRCTIDKSKTTESQSVYVGLFGYIGQGGVVKNIGIVNPKINANAISPGNESAQNTDVFVGAIAGLNYGKIQQCYLSGSGTVGGTGISPCVKNMNVNVGALVGKNEGTIQDCYNCGSTAIKAGFKLTDDYNNIYYVESINKINAGGIAGYNSGSIKNCYNCSAGKITAAQSKRVVYIKESDKKVYNREVLQSYAGAIAGSMSDDSAVENCYYDFWRCSLDSAVGNKEFAECKLTTEDMTIGTYITENVDNMPGLLSEIWLVKGSESGYYFYPHLKGFAYDTETTIDNWPPKVSELDSRNPGGDEAALCALTISSNKHISNSDDAGVSITDAGKVKIDEIKAGTVLKLMYLNDTQFDSSFIGWYSNGKLVTDSSVYEFIISEDVEFEIRCRDENEKIIKFAADLNGEKQIWEIVTYTTNDDISFPEMNFYGFKLDGWKVNGDVNTVSGNLYTTEEAKNEVANKLGTAATTFTVEGVFSRTSEAADSSIPGLDGKYTVTVCCNDVVAERLFRDFAASEYLTFNADEIERYVDTTGKTFSHWLLDDVKISTNREVAFRVAKDCVLNAVYVSDRSSSVKITKVNIDNVGNMKLEAEVNCESSDVIDSVTFRYQVADKVITGKKDEKSYAYTATVSGIHVNTIYAIQPVVIFNNGSEPKECTVETVTVSEGTEVSEITFLYSEESLITKMTVSIDEGKMFLTTVINSEIIAKVLKVRFRYRDYMNTTMEFAGTKDDVTGKYTATISDVDVDKVYSIQPVATINGEPVEGTGVEVLPKHGYDSSEKASVDIVDMKTNDSGVVFAEHIFVPAGCIISRAGVLISIGSDKVSDASVLDTVTDVNQKIYNATIQALSGKIVDERGLTCTHTWTKKNVDQDEKVFVLAYLVYIDEFNIQHIVCGVVKNIIT